jgi:hypothetical protein
MESCGHSEVAPVHLDIAIAKGRAEIRGNGVAQIPVLQKRDKDCLRESRLFGQHFHHPPGPRLLPMLIWGHNIFGDIRASELQSHVVSTPQGHLVDIQSTHRWFRIFPVTNIGRHHAAGERHGTILPIRQDVTRSIR